MVDLEKITRRKITNNQILRMGKMYGSHHRKDFNQLWHKKEWLEAAINIYGSDMAVMRAIGVSLTGNLIGRWRKKFNIQSPYCRIVKGTNYFKRAKKKYNKKMEAYLK